MVGDRVQVARHVAEVGRLPPLGVAEAHQPALAVVVALDLGLVPARASDRQGLAPLRLEPAEPGGLAAGPDQRAVDPVGVEPVARVGRLVLDPPGGVEPVGVPDERRLGPGGRRVQAGAVEEVGPVLGGPHDGLPPRLVAEEAGAVLREVHGDREGGGPVPVLIDDVDRELQGSPLPVGVGELDRQLVVLVPAVPVGEDRDGHGRPLGAIEPQLLARAVRPGPAGQVEVEPGLAGPDDHSGRVTGVRGREDEEPDRRVGDVSLPVHEREAVLVERATEDVLRTQAIRVPAVRRDSRTEQAGHRHQGREHGLHPAGAERVVVQNPYPISTQ